jgi:hypothetical protein
MSCDAAARRMQAAHLPLNQFISNWLLLVQKAALCIYAEQFVVQHCLPGNNVSPESLVVTLRRHLLVSLLLAWYSSRAQGIEQSCTSLWRHRQLLCRPVHL